jgi:hypothetical protein
MLPADFTVDDTSSSNEDFVAISGCRKPAYELMVNLEVLDCEMFDRARVAEMHKVLLIVLETQVCKGCKNNKMR